MVYQVTRVSSHCAVIGTVDVADPTDCASIVARVCELTGMSHRAFTATHISGAREVAIRNVHGSITHLLLAL